MKKDVFHCNFCGSPDYTYPYQRHRNLVECTRCGLIYSMVQLTKAGMENFYSESYFLSDNSGEKGYDSYLDNREGIVKTFQRRLNIIEKYTKGSRKVLDVGCAMGFFLQVARDRGWQAYGLDISDYCISYARKVLNLNARCELMIDSSYSDSSFDLITMWDYLEHSITPKEDLIRAYKLLKKGGILAITTPDVAAIPSKLYKENWIGIKLEEHFYYFNKQLLADHLTNSGFEVLKTGYAGKYVSLSFFLQRLKFYNNMLFRAGKSLSENNLFKNIYFYCNPLDIVFLICRKI